MSHPIFIEKTKNVIVQPPTIIHKVPILILCFHDINTHSRYSISYAEFKQILDLLSHQFNITSLDTWVKTHATMDKPGVVLTFDDGHPSLHKYILPLLEAYNYGATFFIYLDRYSSRSKFYKQLARLPQQFEVGSHSFSHSIIKQDRSTIFKELFLSRKKLEYLTQKTVQSWSWPYGVYNQQLVKLAEYANYKTQVSTDGGIAWYGENNINLSRYTIERPNPVDKVRKILNKYKKQIK